MKSSHYFNSCRLTLFLFYNNNSPIHLKYKQCTLFRPRLGVVSFYSSFFFNVCVYIHKILAHFFQLRNLQLETLWLLYKFKKPYRFNNHRITNTTLHLS